MTFAPIFSKFANLLKFNFLAVIVKLTKFVKTLYKFVIKSIIPEDYSEPCQTSKMNRFDGTDFRHCYDVSIADFEKVNADWDIFFSWNTVVSLSKIKFFS